MKNYAITLSPEEEKALLVDVISIQDWLDNAIHNKARQCIDKVIEEYSNKQPKKLKPAERTKIVREAKVKSALERQQEIERETQT